MYFMSSRWLIAVKIIFQLSQIKKRYSIYEENVCCCKYTVVNIGKFLGYYRNILFHVD